MATGIGASGALCPARAACSDRRPSLPWTSPNQPDEDTTAGHDGDHREARRWRAPLRSGTQKVASGSAMMSSLDASKKGGPKSRPFVNPGEPGLDQFAALLAGLSVEVLSAVVGAVTLTLMPCKRSPAIFKALSSLASGGT